MDIARAKKRDARPHRHGWAPGDYFAKCSTCGCTFIGDKRALTCADCAYAKPDPEPAKQEPAPMSENEGFKAPPIKGYQDVSARKAELVNQHKEIEERILRHLDEMKGNADIDQRWLAIGRTHIEEAWMAINRSVFQPGRVKLPEDAQ